MKLCGALRNLGSEPTQNHYAASRRRCRSLDVWRQMKTHKPTFSHCFQRALLAHCWRWFMCRLSEALVVVGCHAPGSASLHLGLLMVPRLRRWMPPTQLRKADLGTQEFWQSRLIQQSSNPTKFSEFSVLSVDKKWVVGSSPRQVCSCGSWLKMGCGRQPTPSPFAQSADKMDAV